MKKSTERKIKAVRADMDDWRDNYEVVKFCTAMLNEFTEEGSLDEAKEMARQIVIGSIDLSKKRMAEIETEHAGAFKRLGNVLAELKKPGGKERLLESAKKDDPVS